MFHLQSVQYRYQDREVLNINEWQSNAGSQWLIKGRSGSGKTTLLHLMAGLLRPQSGQIIVGGCALQELSERQRDAFRARQIGIVLQRLHLVKPLTVLENLKLAQQCAGLRPDLNRIQNLLATLELSAWQHALPHRLSQGQAQRVAIIRAILHRPPLLLADEPTSSLDDVNCQQVLHLLQSQAKEYGATLVIASHDSRLQNVFTQQLALEMN
ncbi:ABC transporter ATP-binding protein [Thioflexithrix psekupsensis]|uniref:ABC transporter domain-containing protein n=1 Tax=Thioflexithrix psekupsensis TaxID=1570016 RepID=A0A251X7I6_9GAMM|nr:ATP-binding cassette domain-containing protein [Thioflexithrix psekupsensis]OUD13905.1 hypothetical protein TPSD3_06060 [Thioflexithrix psekupsensis]